MNLLCLIRWCGREINQLSYRLATSSGGHTHLKLGVFHIKTSRIEDVEPDFFLNLLSHHITYADELLFLLVK